MKVYELNVFVDGDPKPENHLYPSLASAKWHATEASKLDYVSAIWLRTWSLRRDIGIYEKEATEMVYER